LEKIKKLIEAIEKKKGALIMDDMTREVELYSMPHNTLAYFLNYFPDEGGKFKYFLKDLLKKDKDALVKLIQQHYKMELFLRINRDLCKSIDEKKQGHIYCMKEVGQRWRWVALSTVEYELDHSGSYGKGLMDNLLKDGSVQIPGKTFRVISKEKKH
jgi:hypothetical protein